MQQQGKRQMANVKRQKGMVFFIKEHLLLLRFAFCLLPFAMPSVSWAADAAVSGDNHSAAPIASPTTASSSNSKEGEFTETSKGVNKQTLVIGKLDPPAAFNLEDIQNFPEERLQPVLNNPVTFEEGRDFSTMMEGGDENLIHPWLPDIAKAPFLVMKPEIDKPAKEWTFAVIDQGGAPVYSQDGKGNPSSLFSWSGEDKKRGHIAVDTVYIPQLATTDKEGYRHTYMGAPIQNAAIFFDDKGRSTIEVSSKRVFLDNKSELSKEAPVYLEKVCDIIREASSLPMAIKIYDSNTSLATERTAALAKYFADKLHIDPKQISLLDPDDPEKRGLAIAVMLNSTPGGKND